jgi:hypothetical protein
MKKQLTSLLIGLLLCASLIACDSDEINPPIETAIPVPRATFTSIAKVVPTFPPIPTPEPVSIQRDGEDIVVKGTRINIRWFDEDHIFISQHSFVFGGGMLYIADLNTLDLNYVPEIYSSDVVRSDVTWISKDWVAWLRGGFYASAIAPPDKLFVMNLNDHQKRMLSEQGVIATALPDGSLVIRTGWVDGPIQLLAPPYDAPPTTIAPAGPWTERWFLSPDGETLAWVEMDPPSDPKHSLPDDYLPELMGDSTTKIWPNVRSIVIWNSESGKVQRYPATDMAWPYIDLFWTNDSQTIIYQSDVLKGQGQIALTKMATDGSRSTLVTFPFYGRASVLAEGTDSSLYLQIGDWNWNGDTRNYDRDILNQLVQLHPDGSLKVILDNVTASATEVSNNQLIVAGDEHQWLIDLNTGIPSAIPTPNNCSEYSAHSPGGRWLLQGTDCGPTRITLTQQN